jgi:hypothetical protein
VIIPLNEKKKNWDLVVYVKLGMSQLKKLSRITGNPVIVVMCWSER